MLGKMEVLGQLPGREALEVLADERRSPGVKEWGVREENERVLEELMTMGGRWVR